MQGFYEIITKVNILFGMLIFLIEELNDLCMKTKEVRYFHWQFWFNVQKTSLSDIGGKFKEKKSLTLTFNCSEFEDSNKLKTKVNLTLFHYL